MKHSHGLFALRTTARLTLAALAASTLSVNAAETLDSITVTADRMPSENILAATTVVTRADIERLQITDLPTLLSRQPGIDIAISGGIGKQSSIFMRGTNSSHVLLLVDGVKWYSATAGSPAIQDFPIEQIERIEIVRGPRSGLYGSEAIGGVIQIFTRKGQQGVSPFAKIAYGTHNTKQATAGVRGGNEDTTYNLSFNHQSTDGINAKTNTNPDKDGYRNNNISATINHQFNDKINVQFNALRAQGVNQFDPFFSTTDINTSDFVQQVLGAKANINVTDDWTLSLQLGESRDQSKSYTNGIAGSVFDTRHRTASFNNLIKITDNNKLNLGIDYDVDDVDSTTNFVITSRDNKAVYASWQGMANKHSWLLSVRHDNNEAFGSHNTGTAEWGYCLQEGLQFVATIGTGFKTPTFNDLYYPLSFGYQGNPNLKPEKSRSYEIGLVGDYDWSNWSVRAYETKIDDLIAIKSDFSTVTNINKAKIRGVELEMGTTILGWNTQANISFLKPEDDKTGRILARRAKRLASISADKHWGDWSTGASWKLRGHSFDNAANTTRLGGYGLIDIRAGYQLNKGWLLQASVTNLFDKKYQTVKNYNSLDRTALLTISYKP